MSKRNHLPLLVAPAPTPAEPAPEPRVRHAHRFAAYPGDVAAAVMDDPVMGPNTLGEPMVALYAHFDPVEDRTRVGFTFATTHDIDGLYDRELARLRGTR